MLYSPTRLAAPALGLLCLVLLASPATAAQDDSTETNETEDAPQTPETVIEEETPPAAPTIDPMMVALEADSANQEYCAQANTSGNVSLSSQAQIEAIAARIKVDEAYQQTKAGYLLYWRGALGQCLNITKDAVNDFKLFIEEQSGNSMFSALVRDAQKRLRRLGAKAGSQGGPSTELSRAQSPIELRLGVSGGGGILGIGCTDPVAGPNGSPQHLNSACSSGQSPNPQVIGAAAPVLVDFQFGAYFAERVGLGVQFSYGQLVPADFPNERAPGFSVQAGLGPIFRLQSSKASGRRARALRIQPLFTVALSEVHPWVGNAKYVANQGFIDGGSYLLPSFGGGLRLLGDAELGTRTLLEWALDGAYFAPTATELITTQTPASAAVIRSPAVTGGSRWTAGARLGVLRVQEKGLIGLGPYLDLRLDRSAVGFPNDTADCWDSSPSDDNPSGDCLEGDANHRKVYSTAHTHFLIRFGLLVRFGTKRTAQ